MSAAYRFGRGARPGAAGRNRGGWLRRVVLMVGVVVWAWLPAGARQASCQ